MRDRAAIGYRKLFDLRQADIQLSLDDLQNVADSASNDPAMVAGPVAIVLGVEPPPLLVDMAILLKHRIGAWRRFRLFTLEREARQWLSTEAVGQARKPVEIRRVPARPLMAGE